MVAEYPAFVRPLAMNPHRPIWFFHPNRPFPRRKLSGALLSLCLLLVATGAQAAAERVVLSMSVGTMHPEIAATKRALSAKDLAQSLNFSVAPRVRNFPELQARVARGETFSRAELEARYLPLAVDYEAVKAWAVSQGLTLQQEDSSRLSVFLRSTVAQVQSSLEVNMVEVTSEGVDYPAADSEPSLPDAIAGAVIGVNGLHPYRHLHRHSRIRPQATTGVTYTVPNILTTYDSSNLIATNAVGQTTAITGAGQTIAILIDATPLQTDLASFYTANGIAAATSNNITTINVNGYNIAATEGEETLDVEWTSGVAPGAKIRVYATGDLEDASLDRGMARVLADVGTDATIHQLSISLGLGETYGSTAQFTTDGQYFAALASQGVSTFVSAGDGGSTPDGSGGETGPLQVEYYASDPSVTAVGGTRLSVDSTYAYNSSTAETVWGPYSTTNGATGGGTSIRFVRPSWQTGTMRLVPDVSMPADPYTGAYLFYKGSASVIGGTSWSAPTWAGFCALINQARSVAGSTGGIGLLNPSVYPLIGSTNFHDITVGNNAGSTAAGGKYTAGVGYDECTGAGSPDVRVLMNTLLASGTTAVTQPTIASIAPTSGVVGSTVVITGSGFTKAQTCAFSSVPERDAVATFTINSDTQITATVPPAAENGPVTVTIAGGTASSATAFTVTATSTTPTITSFTPTSGTAGYITYDTSGNGTLTNGTTVTLTGTNFTGATNVTIGGVSGEDYTTPFTVSSATKMTVLVPVDAMTGVIKVTTAKGKAISTSAFTVNARTGVPVVTSFTPTSGAVGTSVTITGTTFTSATGVSFGTIAAQAVTVSSSTKITATVPVGASTGAVVVTNVKGGSANTNAFTVTSAATAPTIGSFTPTSGAAGTRVTISGVAFTGATAVAFNGTPATSYSVNADTQIVATVPTGATTGTISVTTPMGTATSAGAFTVNAPDLTVTLTHAGSFTQADTGDTYTIIVGNGGTSATSGTVTLSDTLPSGLSATALSGTGWTINPSTLTCTRTDALAAGGSYPALTLTVNVAANAAASVTNVATVAGGGETNTANDSASDPTTITALTPSQSWRYQYFGTTANTGNAADTANPSGDGLANIVKYALGLNPLVPTASPVTVDVSTGYLRLTTPKNANATDVTVAVQVNGDLTNPSGWTTNGTTVDQNTPTMLQVQDATAVSNAAARFLRLNVTR